MSEQARLVPEVNGEPVPELSIKFERLPSWNDYLAASHHVGMQGDFMLEWKLVAESAVQKLAQRNKLRGVVYEWRRYSRKQKKHVGKPIRRFRLKTPFFGRRKLALDVHVWRPDAQTFDVHNVCLKPILDGFRDAMLFVSDDVTQIQEVSFVYEGIDKSLAATKQEREQRRVERESLAQRGKRQKRVQVRARYIFKFYTLD